MAALHTPLDADPTVYKTLLESTKAIPWKIDWASATFSYIGPQIEALLGWTPASWMTVQDWADRMHPDDRERVVNFCVSQSQAGVDHEADYRALTKDGHYVWLRDVVHVIRHPDGTVDSLVGFMFDISERKRTEERLLALQKELEELSYKDGLTGVANRRMFDLVFEREWADARRTGRPLAVALLDIDYFKQYNDCYGHLGGDDCLRLIGDTLQKATRRPTDFLARYGGEEFVLVLPDTDEAGALEVAEACRSIIQSKTIAHDGSPLKQITVSIGAASIEPTPDCDPKAFISVVDRRLYLAKSVGRNCIVASEPIVTVRSQSLL